MKYSQIKHMVDRFLMWKLPDNFSPDNGISAVRPNYAPEVSWEPTGTNLLDATQAEAMVRHMVEGLAADEQEEPNPEWEAKADTHHAATLAKVGVEPLQTLKMLERWKADAEPANEFGQVTFSRALLDSATDALRAVIAAQIDTAYEGRLGGEYEVLLTTEALIKVRNLALRRLELGATGSDDDGIALAAFQVEATPKTVLTIANTLLRQQHSDLDLMALLGKRTAERDTAVKTNRSNARSLAVAVLRDCAGKYVRVDSQRDIDRAVDLAERIIVAWPDDPPLFQPPMTK